MNKLINFNKISENLTIRSKGKEDAEIIVYGEIGDSMFGESISASYFSKELDKIRDVKNITLRLNSVGGDVFEGITIYNRLKQHKAKVIVYVDGIAASIASIIMLAGDEIILGEGSWIMIHKPWTVAYGDSRDLQDTIDRLDDIENSLISIYANKTKLSRDEIKTMLAKETWMEADEAIKLGFADSTFANEYQIAASADKPWIKRSPKIENLANKTIKDKITALKSKVNDFIDR